MARWMDDTVAVESYNLIQKGMLKYNLTEKAACQRIGFNPTSIVWLRKRVANILSKEEQHGKEETAYKEDEG